MSWLQDVGQKIGNWFNEQVNNISNTHAAIQSGDSNAYARLHGINISSSSASQVPTTGGGMRPVVGNLGTFSGSDSSAVSFANDQQEFNHNEAQLQRDFVKWQMENQHQIETQDLIAAGLNPILSANNGAGIGGGASASASQSMDIAKLSAATQLQAAQIAANSAATVAGMYTDAQRYTSNVNFASDIISNIFAGTLGRTSRSFNNNISNATSNITSNITGDYTHHNDNFYDDDDRQMAYYKKQLGDDYYKIFMK